MARLALWGPALVVVVWKVVAGADTASTVGLALLAIAAAVWTADALATLVRGGDPPFDERTRQGVAVTCLALVAIVAAVQFATLV